jgi:hypothetical protein
MKSDKYSKLDAAQVRSLFSYDSESGIVTRKVTTSAQAKAGTTCECKDQAGYFRVKIRGESYSLHRIVWLMHYGNWPEYEIDHIDGNKQNNRIENLRDVPRSVNCQNLKRPLKNGTSGYLGVTFVRGNYKSQVMVNGKRKQLGGFVTPEEAFAAYLSVKQMLGGDPISCQSPTLLTSHS